MRQVEQIMGMPISIDIPLASDWNAFKKAFSRLKTIDNRFSTYKSDSEVTRFRKGNIAEPELSAELKEVIKQCRSWETATGGYFSAWAGGAFEPSGYVKGWAISQAGEVIEDEGFTTYCIGAGGDILARSAGTKTWQIGIQDPDDKARILNKLSISNGAVCTSGTYERGKHIFNPITKKAAKGFISVTISGPDIISADVLATAVFAAGPKEGKEILKKFPDYKALIVV